MSETLLPQPTQPVDTELPAAAALADGASNPTVPGVGAFGMVWNGASWERTRGDLGDGSAATGVTVNNPLLYNGATYDRARGDLTSGQWVNIKASVGLTGTKTNNNAAPGATNVGVLPGVANAAVQTWTEGDQVLESMDLSGNERVTLGTALSQAIDSIMAYPFGHSYANFTTAQTATVVKSGAGTLHSITINTPVASGTIEYDDAITHTNSMGKVTLPASLLSSGPQTILLDIGFATGLCITTTGTMDITFSYR